MDIEDKTGYVPVSGTPEGTAEMADAADTTQAPRTRTAEAPEAPAPTEPANVTEPAEATDTPAERNPANKPTFPIDALPDLRQTLTGQPEDIDPAEAKSRAEFTTVFDIIDKLEEALDEAKAGLFTPGQVKVDRESFAADLDELKRMLPVQLERASALMREAERRLESAQTQANAIVASAQSRAADMVRDANEQAQFLAGQENVTELARQKARAILDQAQAKSDHLTQGADRYCVTLMEGLQQQLGKLGQDVSAGLNVLYERQRTAGEQLPRLDDNNQTEV